MIALVLEYPCTTCGKAMRIPTPLRPPTLPVKLEIVIPTPPHGWTYDATGAHCPAHPAQRVVPVTVMPDLSAINGRRHG